MFITDHLLSLLVWFPIVGGCLVIITKPYHRIREIPCWCACVVAIITLLLCTFLYLNFDPTIPENQFVEKIDWFNTFNDCYSVYYHLSVDGFSVLFIILSSFTNLVIILVAWNCIKIQLYQYMAICLFITGLTNGIFCAQDTTLFYIFWEALLIPTILGIGIWGGKRKSYVAIRYFLYNFIGSIFFLIALLYIQKQVALMPENRLVDLGSFSIVNFINWATDINNFIGDLVSLTSTTQWLLLGALFMSFAVKIPIWPLHSWFLDVHSEAPAGGSIVLALLMLKPGAYGFLRFFLPLIPLITEEKLITLLISLSLITVVYVGIVAISQTDFKRLIAYSSISHMGLVILAIFSIFLLVNNNLYHMQGILDAQLLIQGAIFQMVTHGLASGGMFIGCGYLHFRMKTSNISDFQGLASVMPIFAVFFMLFSLANISLPGTCGFVGEFLIIITLFKYSPLVGLIASMTFIITPVYTLYTYKRVFFGQILSLKVKKLKDITGIEIFIFILLSVPILLFGFYPEPILNISSQSAAYIIQGLHFRTIP